MNSCARNEAQKWESKKYPGMEKSSVWQPWYSLETLKLAFNVSSKFQGCHPDDLSVSVWSKKSALTIHWSHIICFMISTVTTRRLHDWLSDFILLFDNSGVLFREPSPWNVKQNLQQWSTGLSVHVIIMFFNVDFTKNIRHIYTVYWRFMSLFLATLTNIDLLQGLWNYAVQTGVLWGYT